MSNNANELLTIQQLADELGVPVATVYDWRRRRIGPRSAKFGNVVRYRRRDIDKWIDQHMEEGA